MAAIGLPIQYRVIVCNAKADKANEDHLHVIKQ